MSKEFYTEKDIDDLFQRGIRSLQVSENVVLTGLAYEKAHRLGLQLVSDRAANPPAAPVRPYLSEAGTARAKPAAAPVAPTILSPVRASIAQPSARESDVEQRIRSAVVAQLGNQVDTKLLDNIIHRVVKGVGLK